MNPKLLVIAIVSIAVVVLVVSQIPIYEDGTYDSHELHDEADSHEMESYTLIDESSMDQIPDAQMYIFTEAYLDSSDDDSTRTLISELLGDRKVVLLHGNAGSVLVPEIPVKIDVVDSEAYAYYLDFNHIYHSRAFIAGDVEEIEELAKLWGWNQINKPYFSEIYDSYFNLGYHSVTNVVDDLGRMTVEYNVFRQYVKGGNYTDVTLYTVICSQTVESYEDHRASKIMFSERWEDAELCIADNPISGGVAVSSFTVSSSDGTHLSFDRRYDVQDVSRYSGSDFLNNRVITYHELDPSKSVGKAYTAMPKSGVFAPRGETVHSSDLHMFTFCEKGFFGSNMEQVHGIHVDLEIGP